MQPLNAIDAIAPAFTRTHQTLFAPFRLGRSWKLCATSYVAFAGAIFIPWPLILLVIPSRVYSGLAPLHAVVWLTAFVWLLLSLVVLYFGARMELVDFEKIVTRAQFIAPMWRRYSSRVWPWIGLKIAVGTVLSTLLALALYVPMRNAILMLVSLPAMMGNLPAGRQPDQQAVFAMMSQMMSFYVAFYGLILFFFFVLKTASTLLNDFVKPFYILEPLPLTAALSRGLAVFLADPVQILLYLILKFILAIIGYMMQSIALNVCLLPFMLVFFLGMLVAGVGMKNASAPTSALLIAVGIVLFLAFFAAIVYLSIAGFGYLLTLLEAYGIYFLAGRYPLLGNMLEPGPGAPFTPPPVFPSPDERNEDDGGPPLPLDPAVA